MLFRSKGKVDELRGLKENVIIGTLIPAGTGMMAYRNTTTVPAIEENKELFEHQLEETVAAEKKN